MKIGHQALDKSRRYEINPMFEIGINPMFIMIVHNDITKENAPEENDVLVQAQIVSEALEALGHETEQIACSLNLDSIKAYLKQRKPDLVFNLVESLDGSGRLIHLFPSLLDALQIPYTGSKAETIFQTSNKIIAKQVLASLNLNTPACFATFPVDRSIQKQDRNVLCHHASQWIIKSIWEHASAGLDDNGIIMGTDSADILKKLKKCAFQMGGACFAEAFINGREFNISILSDNNGAPQVLPAAEIIFEGYDDNKPKIVGYQAKWEQDSYEFNHTRRSFDNLVSDHHLLSKLYNMSKTCWYEFRLRGYARIDFRVDNNNEPWILEINTNPCLSPDAGFAAAISQAGLSFQDAINRIIRDVYDE